MQETLHFDPVSGPDQLAALQGGGARLPLLPGARPRAARADAGDAGDRPRGDPRAPGRAHRALRERLRPGRGHRAPVRVRARVGRLLRAPALPATARAAPGRTGQLAPSCGAAWRRTPSAGRSRRRRSAARRSSPPQGRQRGARPAGLDVLVGDRGGASRRGSARGLAATESRRELVGAGASGRRRRTSSSASRRQVTKAIAHRRPVMRETKGRADGGEVTAPDPRASSGLTTIRRRCFAAGRRTPEG